MVEGRDNETVDELVDYLVEEVKSVVSKKMSA